MCFVESVVLTSIYVASSYRVATGWYSLVGLFSGGNDSCYCI